MIITAFDSFYYENKFIRNETIAMTSNNDSNNDSAIH
jgi:hypothetical protein